MYELPKVFVKPGEGRKVPLPIAGGEIIHGLGKLVTRTVAVERLIASGDLVVPEPPKAEPAAAMKEKG
jgi:hypothetical protein